MINPLRKLAGQTAIYGLPSIVGRLLNYVLVPIHTAVFLPEKFGVIIEMYAYVSFLVVLLTYGMETAFFRFNSKEENNKDEVFTTTVLALIATTVVFISVAYIFAQKIANYISYPDNAEYVIWFAFIVGLDAISSIPLAKLRDQNRSTYFAMVNLASIFLNVGLNVFWIGYCIPAYQDGVFNIFTEYFFTPTIGVGYVFIANLFASALKFLLLSPIILKAKWKINFGLLKKMLSYGWPILVGSLAIIVNENLDKILIKWLLKDDIGIDEATAQAGIYGACYKISIIISIFIQAFRYAAEPFFFNQSKEQNAAKSYALVMKYFVIVCSFIFLGVMLYMDIIKHFVRNEEYWVGLGVVPFLLMANIFLGIFYNLSIWYKLSGKTRYGATISLIGAIITIILNLILIPRVGYMGSAVTTLICYGTMVVISYYLGQKHFPVTYPVRRILFYLSAAVLLYLGSTFLAIESQWLNHALNLLFLGAFIGLVVILEKPKKVLIS
jgi:O-antigen/teichoic acid export membrane protein